LCVEDADKATSFDGALLGWSVEGDAGPGQASTGGPGVGIHDRDPSSLFELFFTLTPLPVPGSAEQQVGDSLTRGPTSSRVLSAEHGPPRRTVGESQISWMTSCPNRW
jgi:hypothetical protein